MAEREEVAVEQARVWLTVRRALWSAIDLFQNVHRMQPPPPSLATVELNDKVEALANVTSALLRSGAPQEGVDREAH